MKVEVCYADEVYQSSIKYNVRNAYKKGKFDKVYAYNRESLDKEFVRENERFFKFSRGGGYWIWKSYIIQKTLKELNDGDYLFYCDAGAFFIKPVDILIKLMEDNHEDMMFFAVSGCLEKEWTKRDVFITLGCDSKEYAESIQIMSTCVLIKKNNNTVNFIDEYVKYSQEGMIITDEENVLGVPNYDGFKANRHDQSILSLLAKKHKYMPYRDPTQWGGYQKYQYKYRTFLYEQEYGIYEKSKYPTILLQHRLRGNASLRGILGCYKNYLINCMKLKINKGKL